MLKDYFIQKLKLRSNKPITGRDITKFLQTLDATIKAVDKIIDKKVKEFLNE